MAIRDLQGKDICAIIKTCANAGVSEFAVGDFTVKFGTRTLEPEGTTAPIEGTQSLPPQPGMTDEQNDNQYMDLLQQKAVQDLAQNQTLLDSPVMFEDDMVDDMINERGRGV